MEICGGYMHEVFRVLWLVHSISVISSYTLVWPYMVNDCAKLKISSPESGISLWIKPKYFKKPFFCGKFGSIPTFRSTRKGKKCFCDEPTSVWPQGITQHRIFIKFFDFAWVFSLPSLVILTSKFLECKEFNKTLIPFALVGYETGYSQLGATRLVGYLPPHNQRALME